MEYDGHEGRNGFSVYAGQTRRSVRSRYFPDRADMMQIIHDRTILLCDISSQRRPQKLQKDPQITIGKVMALIASPRHLLPYPPPQVSFPQYDTRALTSPIEMSCPRRDPQAGNRSSSSATSCERMHGKSSDDADMDRGCQCALAGGWWHGFRYRQSFCKKRRQNWSPLTQNVGH